MIMLQIMYVSARCGWRRTIGIGKRIAVIKHAFKRSFPTPSWCLVDPEVIRHERKRNKRQKACLAACRFSARESLGTADICVTVRAQDVEGIWFEKTGDDLLARAFLHEIDHLNGRLSIRPR